jgi:hypothetical protein
VAKSGFGHFTLKKDLKLPCVEGSRFLPSLWLASAFLTRQPQHVLTIYHTSELATSLAISIRLHILGPQSDRLHPVAAVVAPASVPQSAEERRERSAGPIAGPPVLASVPLGGSIRFVHRGRTILDSPCSPHLAARVCTSHAPSSGQLRSLLSLHQPKGAHRRCFLPAWRTGPSSSRKP